MYEIQCQKKITQEIFHKVHSPNMSNGTASSQTGTKTGNNGKHPNHKEQLPDKLAPKQVIMGNIQITKNSFQTNWHQNR